jgi:hypothetical protein
MEAKDERTESRRKDFSDITRTLNPRIAENRVQAATSINPEPSPKRILKHLSLLERVQSK